MCGILCCFSPTDDSCSSFHDRLLKLKHRGPDETTVKRYVEANLTTFTVGFVRNAISNVLDGSQPIEAGKFVHVHNGEFYGRVCESWVDSDRETRDGSWRTHEDYLNPKSDSFKLSKMTSENAMEFAQTLDGIFAYCSYDSETQTLYVARDRVGVIPLYYVKEVESTTLGHDNQVYERIWFASEAKALVGLGDIYVFPPNSVMSLKFDNFDLVTNTKNILPPYPKEVTDDKTYDQHSERIDRLLRVAVIKRNQFEVPWGICLSGGVDSGYLAFIKQHSGAYGSSYWENDGQSMMPRDGFRTAHTFSIGLKSSEELGIANEYAQTIMVASQHHSIEVTVEEAISVLEDVIWTVETYDVTTVRASIMNYLLAKYMKRFGIKQVVTGEGSDEIFGGYLYFHKCPNKEHMQFELVRKLEQLHYYDCLRANKCFAAFGIECRLPFLDRDFVDYVMNIDPVHKLSSTHPEGPKQEKHLLRNSFHRSAGYDYLTADNMMDFEKYIYRRKDQFSDSVGKEHIEGLKSHAEKCVTDEQMEKAVEKFPFQTPNTKEAYYYREIFEKLFLCSGRHFVKFDPNSVACSTTIGAAWCKDVEKDPSGQGMKEALG